MDVLNCKICRKCKQEKLKEQFNRRNKSKDGRQSYCKDCSSRRNKRYYWMDIEKTHREMLAKRQNNKSKTAIYNRRYKQKYPERRRQTKHNNYIKAVSSITGKINWQMRSSVYLSLKGNKNGRHWEDLIGYTKDELKQHLEKQFVDGMSWDNYGRCGWSIDHKMPISFFKFTSPEEVEFKMCWRLENLRPLWHTDNISKGAKILPELLSTQGNGRTRTGDG